jgi:hypothetical protein
MGSTSDTPLANTTMRNNANCSQRPEHNTRHHHDNNNTTTTI